MNTRAKFKVSHVSKYAFGEQVHMNAVCYDDNDENKSFSKYTPSGSFEMMITNEALFGNFKPDEEYYFDLTKVEPKDQPTA